MIKLMATSVRGGFAVVISNEVNEIKPTLAVTLNKDKGVIAGINQVYSQPYKVCTLLKFLNQ